MLKFSGGLRLGVTSFFLYNGAADEKFHFAFTVQ